MKIEEGYTFNFLFTSLILSIIGVISLFLNIYIGIVIIAIAVLLLFEKAGTILDIEENRIGIYKSIIIRYSLKWTKLSRFNKACLDFKFTSQRMNSRGTSSVIKTKIYKLILISPEYKLVFHEYSNYEISKQVLQSLKDSFNFEVVDKYHEIQKDSLKRREIRKNKKPKRF